MHKYAMERACIPQPSLLLAERLVVLVCCAFLSVDMWTRASQRGHMYRGKYHSRARRRLATDLFLSAHFETRTLVCGNIAALKSLL